MKITSHKQLQSLIGVDTFTGFGSTEARLPRASQQFEISKILQGGGVLAQYSTINDCPARPAA